MGGNCLLGFVHGVDPCVVLVWLQLEVGGADVVYTLWMKPDCATKYPK